MHQTTLGRQGESRETVRRSLRPAGGIELTQSYTAWGGVPRYWELAADLEARSDRASTRWCSIPSVRFTASRTVC